MLKLGEKIIIKLYLGDKKIAKAFLGDKLVYKADKPIFLDYVEFDGASYIDTGIVPTEYTGAYINSTQTKSLDSVILGCRTDNANTRLFLFAKSYGAVNIGRNTYKYLRRDGSFGTEDFYTTTKNPIEIWSNYLNNRVLRAKYREDDITSVELETLTFTPTLTMYLGCQNKANEPLNFYKGYISKCIITEGDAVIQDLRPCINPKGVVCMYDTVTGKYFYNQGTGEFIAGNKL